MKPEFEEKLHNLLREANDLNYSFDPGKDSETQNWLVKQALRVVVAILEVATGDYHQLGTATYALMYVRVIVNKGHARDFKTPEAQDSAIHAEARRWGRNGRV